MILIDNVIRIVIICQAFAWHYGLRKEPLEWLEMGTAGYSRARLETSIRVSAGVLGRFGTVVAAHLLLLKKTLWAMAAVSFLAVYRELFEIVLFYQALWVQAGTEGRGPLFGGIAAAAAVLLVFGWLIFRYSMRLPIGPFFTVTSVMIAVLAVAFAGQGVAALQEAGRLPANSVDFVTIPALGIFPTLQSLAAQLLVLLVVIGGFYLAGRNARAQRPRGPAQA
jgi:high-affinity iron transporter